MSMELTCDRKVEIRFRSQNSAIIKELQRSVHFSLVEVEAISLIYLKILIETKSITNQIPRTMFRTIFTDCFDITDEFLIDRSFLAIEADASASPDVTLQTWVRALSLLLRGTLEEKIQYCFKVYDLRGNGRIERNHMVTFISRCFETMSEADATLAAKDLVDFLIKKIDIDCDGIVSFDDYRTAVFQMPELLQCLGQCLPNRTAAFAFLATFTDMHANKY